MRFCLITTFYPPYHFGGDALFVYRLANGLASRGHTVEVIHCLDAYHSLTTELPEKAYPNHEGITVHSLKSAAGILSPLLTQQTGVPVFKSRKIQEILEAGKFDVIHFHNISLVGGPAILGFGEGVKLYTTHEYWLICPTHVLFKMNREACVEPQCFKCLLTYKRPPQLWRYGSLMKEAVSHIDAFLTPSKFAAEMHKSRGLELPAVHLPLFAPSPPDAENDRQDAAQTPNSGKPYFLFVGRLELLKGLQEVIPVFQQYPNADLLIAGTGTYQSHLQELAAGNERIKFLGNVAYAKLVALFRGAIAVIVPSLCYETFGLVVAEAFSLQTPVIVKDIGALREIVQESNGGILYRQADELRQAMEAMQTDPELRQQYSRNGYESYLKKWTEESYFRAYFELIDAIQQRKGWGQTDGNGANVTV